MADSVTFHVRVNGGDERTITVASGIYIYAVAAVPALLGVDLPADVEIWVPSLLPEYGPFHYRIYENEYGNFAMTRTLATEPPPPDAP